MAYKELLDWQKNIVKKDASISNIAKGFQNKVNSLIPDKVHSVITEGIKAMVKTVQFGSKYITDKPLRNKSLEEREALVRKKTEFYKKAAAISGAGTGGAGLLIGLADFPILLSLKIKFLFDVAGIYSFDVRNYKERLYILYVFQLAFSSKKREIEIYNIIKDWESYSENLPENQEDFNWRLFQQEYRDYMDIAKMLQIVPGIGAVIGGLANYSLMKRLGITSMNAYRMRVFKTN